MNVSSAARPTFDAACASVCSRRFAYAAAPVGRRLPRPSRRDRHLAHHRGRSARTSAHRHHAIWRDAAARRQEVVLTFDDGPLPRYTNQILDILAAECVKATFFLVGRMAQAYPEGVRRMRDAGHTVGTHSQNHPLSFTGCRSTAPGRRSKTASRRPPRRWAMRRRSRRSSAFPACCARRVEDYLPPPGPSGLERRFPGRRLAHIVRRQVSRSAMQRLEAKGKGILLLHDIQPRTVARAAGDPARTEGARLSRRSCGAGDAGSAEDADRARPWRLHPTRRWWRSRAGPRYRASSSPTPPRFPPRLCPISICIRGSWLRLSPAETAAFGARRGSAAADGPLAAAMVAARA